MASNAREKAEELQKKAAMLASIHSEEYRLNKTVDALLTLSSLFVSIFILAFSFAQADLFSPHIVITEASLKVILSLLAFAAICLSLTAMFFQPGVKAARSREAVIKYSKIKNRIEQKLLADPDVSVEYVNDLQELYLSGEDVPIIPDNRFLELKKRYLQNQKTSEAIKKDLLEI